MNRSESPVPPVSPPGGPTSSAGRTGRPPLTERRKAATRLEIAREAVRLFAAQGVAGTSADDIARAAGISTRTLWRYFSTKEGCVQPLLAEGMAETVRFLGAWPADRPLAEAWEHAERLPGADVDGDAVLELVRLTRTEPGLRAVWLQAHQDAEPVFADLLARRTGRSADDLHTKVRAAMINAALATAIEHHAWVGDDTVQGTFAAALRIAARGLPDRVVANAGAADHPSVAATAGTTAATTSST